MGSHAAVTWHESNSMAILSTAVTKVQRNQTLETLRTMHVNEDKAVLWFDGVPVHVNPEPPLTPSVVLVVVVHPEYWHTHNLEPVTRLRMSTSVDTCVSLRSSAAS